jgi:hypothetical protein
MVTSGRTVYTVDQAESVLAAWMGGAQ